MAEDQVKKEKKKPGRKRKNPFAESTPPPVEFPHVCSKLPHISANNYEQLDELFGWRCMSKSGDGDPMYRPQSWSRLARAESKRKAAKEKTHDKDGN